MLAPFVKRDHTDADYRNALTALSDHQTTED
jgi:hypothetical protein